MPDPNVESPTSPFGRDIGLIEGFVRSLLPSARFVESEQTYVWASRITKVLYIFVVPERIQFTEAFSSSLRFGIPSTLEGEGITVEVDNISFEYEDERTLHGERYGLRETRFSFEVLYSDVALERRPIEDDFLSLCVKGKPIPEPEKPKVCTRKLALD